MLGGARDLSPRNEYGSTLSEINDLLVRRAILDEDTLN